LIGGRVMPVFPFLTISDLVVGENSCICSMYYRALSYVLQDCLIVNTFRYCYFPQRQTDVAQMLQDRQHKTEDKFDCSEVFAFIVKSVTPDYQKAVQLRYQLCNVPFL
jgi:hypothetical protein